MDKKRLKARALACIMAASMCINMYPMSRVWADEEGTEGTEDIAIEEVTEEGQGEEQEEMIAMEAPPVEDPCLKNRLLVGTENPDIFRHGEVILSSYDGVYLVGFPTEEDLDEGYEYYKEEADIVEYDREIMAVSDDESSEAETDGEDGSSEEVLSDPISILNDIVDDRSCPQGTIAVIDTGADEGAAEYISVIGEDGGDDHGHGSRVIKRILMENPDANIISVKAFGSDGRAMASDIYAAFMYAIERDVSYINLSAASISSKDSEIVKDAIAAAVDSGITVVGAAGNYGKDASYFIPGCIDGAVIIGSADEEGRRQEVSNYGDSVDYYVEAESTSIAAARFTGIISKDGIESVKNGNTEKGIYTKEMIKEPVDHTQDEIQGIIDSLSKEERRSYLENIYDILNEEETEEDALREIEAMFEVQDQWEVSSDWCAGYLSRRLIGEGKLPGGSITQSVYQLRGMLEAAGWSVVKDTGRAHYSMGSSQIASDINAVAKAGDAILFYGNGADVMYMVHCGYANGNGTMDDKPGQYRALRTNHNINGYVTATTGAKGTNGFVIYRRNVSYDYYLTVEKSSSTTFKPSMKGIRYDLTDSNGTPYATFTLDADGKVTSASDITVTAARVNSTMRNVSAVKGEDGRYYYHFTIDNITGWSNSSFKIIERSTNGNYTLNAGQTYVRDWDAGEYKLINGTTNTNMIDGVVAGDLKGMIEVYKVDDGGKPLSGAVFSVTNAGGTEVGRITTNEKGYGTLTNLNGGSYKVKEIKAPAGFSLSSTVYSVSIDTSKTFALVGQSYSYVFNSDYYVTANEDLKRNVGTDKGRLATHFLEYGIKEGRRSAEGFDVNAYKNAAENADLRRNFGNNTELYYLHYQNSGAKEQRMGRRPADYQALKEGVSGSGAVATIKTVNHAKRADFKFSKRDEAGRPMADVEFVIKSETTGETKTIKTDANGNYESSKAGLWFEMNKDGTKTPKQSGQGALPIGTYTVTEKRCEANKGRQLEPAYTFKVEDSITYVVKDGNVTGNDITNVELPEIGTTASVVETGSKLAMQGSDITIRDVVTYSRLKADTDYTLVGKLMVVSEDGSAVVYKNAGKDYIVAKNFKTQADYKKSVYEVCGNTTVDFKINTKDLDGKKLVVFEKLYLGKNAPADGSAAEQYKENPSETIFPVEHEDIASLTQTVNVPVLKTSAGGSGAEDKLIYAEKNATVVDKLTYKNLLPGEKYIVKGKLMDKATGKTAVDSSGKEITAQKEFTADKAEGYVDISYTFDASGMGGKTLVVFEYVYYKDILVMSHDDINDEAQTVYLPLGSTTAVDTKTKDHILLAEKTASITDTLTYKNLKPGVKYTVKGTLMDKETGKALKGADGKDIIVSKEFTAEKSDGTFVIPFNFDASLLAGKTVVVYEDVYYNGKAVIVHHNINDTNQTLRIPSGGTKARDAKTGEQMLYPEKEAAVIDTVSYKNLIPGKKYTVKGTLMDKATGKALTSADGKEITSSREFTADKADGSIEMSFTFDASLLVGKTIVAFEDILYNGKEVVIHHDINDEAQTIYSPLGSTTAKDNKTGTHLTLAEKNASITDTLTYKNLIPGKKYTVKGMLMDKATGKPVTGVDGKEISVSKEFTTDKKDGSIDMVFNFDADILKGHTIVVFEDVYYNGKLIITHHDLNDESQTIHIPECSTDAKDGKTGTKTGKAEPDAEVKDTVAYSNLIPGEEYVAKGVLMDKESGEPLRDENNKEITGTAAFVPEKADGLIDVSFKFDASGLKNKTVVVFEEVFQGEGVEGVAVLVHKDINDVDQAVTFIYEEPDQPPKTPPENVTPPKEITPPEKVTPPTPTPPSDVTPPTGDSISIILLVIVSMAAAVGALVVERKKRKK